jgi:hypothetical protein
VLQDELLDETLRKYLLGTFNPTTGWLGGCHRFSVGERTPLYL